ncbi:nuclear transport factor 2 family protein [Emcibacter sp.]|uniref:nuclear transport factor 2 family protein n=1 Tax=Emcibacter sp. TaxID=1979954 RepID=UPI002AA6B3AF|nr:nuclear transport factor 2 family protein [Emcibacter sp.]
MQDVIDIVEQRTKAVEAYVQAFEDGDADAVLVLYADEATVEDPYGTEAIRGRDAIHAFYLKAMELDARLFLDGPVRVAGDIAAFPFTVHVTYEGKKQRLEVIDTFRFDAEGKIIEMRAFWGPLNIQEV